MSSQPEPSHRLDLLRPKGGEPLTAPCRGPGGDRSAGTKRRASPVSRHVYSILFIKRARLPRLAPRPPKIEGGKGRGRCRWGIGRLRELALALCPASASASASTCTPLPHVGPLRDPFLLAPASGPAAAGVPRQGGDVASVRAPHRSSGPLHSSLRSADCGPHSPPDSRAMAWRQKRGDKEA
jgi:hypothetical protein